MAVARDAPVYAAGADTDDSFDDRRAAMPADVLRRGRAASAFGRAVHAALQYVDVQDPDPRRMAELCAQCAKSEGILSSSAEIEAAVARALHSDVLGRASKARRRWRELFVAAPIADRAVEGFVDLVFEVETADGSTSELVVVDYKTDAVTGPAAATRAAFAYGPQLGAYALALEHTTGRRVGECVLLFTSGSVAHEVSVTGHELAQLKQRVRQVLSEKP